MQIGARIRRHRQARGLSQGRLAVSVSVSASYISRLEAGHFARPSAAILLRIARALELDSEILWEHSARPAAPRADQSTLSDLAEQLRRLAQTLSQVRGLPIRDAGAVGTRERVGERLILEDPHWPPHRWALRVEGPVPQGHGIRTGDYVVVDPDRVLEIGMLVVVRINGDVLLMPYAPEVSTTALPSATLDDPASAPPRAQILGSVAAVVRLVAAPGVPAGATGAAPRNHPEQRV